MIGDGNSRIFNDNSLLPTDKWRSQTATEIKLGSFDIVLANPPFGKSTGNSLDVEDLDTMTKDYDLRQIWQERNGVFMKTNRLKKTLELHILFIERCLNLLKEGGRMGIVLPESLLRGANYEYIRRYLMDRAEIFAVVVFPEALFKTSGKEGTSKKVASLFVRKGIITSASAGLRHYIFMANVNHCGHDSRASQEYMNARGDRVPVKDEIPNVATTYDSLCIKVGEINVKSVSRIADASAEERRILFGEMGIMVPSEKIQHHRIPISQSFFKTLTILVPKYYYEFEQIKADIDELRLTGNFEVSSIRDLENRGAISIDVAPNIGAQEQMKRAPDRGARIPLVKTPDIANWEISVKPSGYVKSEVYEFHKERVEAIVRENTILIVKGGRGRIGNSVMATSEDLPMVPQGFYCINILPNPHTREGDINISNINVWKFFATLNMPIVIRQFRLYQFAEDTLVNIGDIFKDI